MRKLTLIAALAALVPTAIPASAFEPLPTFTFQSGQKEPESEEAKLRKARKENNTTRQVTPDPKKSPGKHADNLSKNVNHEADRTSKNINLAFQGKKTKKEINNLRKARAKDNTVQQVTVDPKKSPGKHADNLSKNVNREANRTSKSINRFFQGKKKSSKKS